MKTKTNIKAGIVVPTPVKNLSKKLGTMEAKSILPVTPF